MMETITFNHYFEKIGFVGGDLGHYNIGKGYALLLLFMRTGPERAILVSVSEVKVADLPVKFVDYDTRYIKHPRNKVTNIPAFFPTLRRYTDARVKEYNDKIGVEFKVEIDELFGN